MKILKELDEIKLVIVEMEVNQEKKRGKALHCAQKIRMGITL